MAAERSALRRALRLLAIYFGLVGFFVLALTLVYALPRGPVIENLGRSLPLLEREGLYPAPVLEDSALMLDNFTDALMLNMAASRAGANPLEAALLTLNAGEATDTIAGLRKTVSGKPPSEPYTRYWHGYQLLLRPALLFLSLGDIRYLNMIVFAVALLSTVLLMRSRLGLSGVWAFALALLLSGFYVVPLSLQFSSVGYLMLAGVAAVLLVADKKRFQHMDIELFFVVGMLTAFFDLLTAPLLTLGMPLVALVALRSRETPARTVREDALLIAKLSLAWVVGYVASWAAKWLIASLVGGAGVLRDAAITFAHRAGLDDRGTNHVLAALRDNLLRLVPTVRGAGTGAAVPVVLLVVASIVWLLLYWRFRRPSSRIGAAAHVMLLAPLPYLWFVLAKQHSAQHFWFTYRIQAISVFAIAFLALECVDFDRLGVWIRQRLLWQALDD